jgi:hypothetical protein
LNPREIAYYNAPSRPAFVVSGNYAMSSPAFAPERHEIWYSEGRSGFYAVRLTNGAWPSGAVVPEAPFAIMLPVAGLLVLGTWLVNRRKRTVGHKQP